MSEILKNICPEEIAIVRRWSKLESDIQDYGLTPKNIVSFYGNEENYLKKLTAHEDQLKNIEMIRNMLLSSEIFTPKDVSKEHLAKFRLIICLAGDGFLNYVSHFIKDQLVATVNIDPGRSRGNTLTFDTPEEFLNFYPQMVKGNYDLEARTRLEILLNNRPINPLCLSFVQIADLQVAGAGMSDYKITYRGVTERQKTSGILLATGSGSNETAWYSKIFKTQQRKDAYFSPDQKEARFIIRDEPYDPDHPEIQLSEYSIVAGNLLPDEELIVEPLRNKFGVLPEAYPDDAAPVPIATKISVRIAQQPLNIIVPINPIV